jgi:hypothetical protein
MDGRGAGALLVRDFSLSRPSMRESDEGREKKRGRMVMSKLAWPASPSCQAQEDKGQASFQVDKGQRARAERLVARWFGHRFSFHTLVHAAGVSWQGRG